MFSDLAVEHMQEIVGSDEITHVLQGTRRRPTRPTGDGIEGCDTVERLESLRRRLLAAACDLTLARRRLCAAKDGDQAGDAIVAHVRAAVAEAEDAVDALAVQTVAHADLYRAGAARLAGAA